MEKTVDINENCQFMEDLEMLSAAPPDDLSSFMGDTSPNDSQNGVLGSFRFRGNSNPLEQLGLYRKDDDEEEEEVEAPQNAPDPAANDVEERGKSIDLDLNFFPSVPVFLTQMEN